MVPALFHVVLDANVLFPFTLRDTLLRAAALGMYQVYWSEEILHEVTRNLVATGRMREDQAARLLDAMRNAFPEAHVCDYESLISSMENDEKDRHVAAAAVKVGAQVIVTNNLKDFYSMPIGLEVQSPDDFLLNLLYLAPDAMLQLLRGQANALKRPPVTLDELLTGLRQTVPRFEKLARSFFVEDGHLKASEG